MKTNIIIPGQVSWERKTPFKKRLAQEITDIDGVEVVPSLELSYGIENGEPYLSLHDNKMFRGSSELPDWAILHGVPSSVAFFLEKMGIRCFSSYALSSLDEDKSKVQILLSDIFTMPDTVVYPGNMNPTSLSRFPVIVKGVGGSGGENVWRCENPESVEKVIAEHQPSSSSPLMWQESMPTGDDLRVYMLGKECLGAIVRHVPDGQFKANLSSNPTRTEYALADDEMNAILKALDRLPGPSGLMSFDFLFNDNKELVFCELNTGCGTQALEEFGKADGLIRRYVDYANMDVYGSRR